MWALTRENLSLEFANNKVADQKVSHLDFTVQSSASFVNTFYNFFVFRVCFCHTVLFSRGREFDPGPVQYFRGD